MKNLGRKIICVLLMCVMTFSVPMVKGICQSKEVKAAVNFTENAIYKFTNVSTGRVIDIDNGSNENNVKVQTYSSNGTAAQQFKLIESVEHQGCYVIVPMCAQTRAIDNTNESRSEGNAYQIYQQTGGEAQEFTFESVGNDQYRIVSKQSGMALSDEGSVVQRNKSSDTRQYWRIEMVEETYATQNPVRLNGNDPWVIKAGGKYYFCQSDGGIGIYKANNIEDLGSAKYYNVFKNDYQGDVKVSSYWAPELLFVSGRWYIYFAPEVNNGGNDSHRMYVLEGGSNPNDPLDGSYTFKGRIADTANDKWAIDGTVFTYNNRNYFVWSGWDGDVNVAQNIYIAEMSNPWTLSSQRVCISRPTQGWETNTNPTVNEGPEVLMKDGKVFIIYSASGSWTNSYCLGMLTCEDGNFLNPSSWVKTSDPVFSQGNGVFGPGHCSFVKSNDGTEDWIVYHAAKRDGSGWDRDVRIQMFTWKNGKPYFGVPTAAGVKIGKPSKNNEKYVNTNSYYRLENVATGRNMDIPNGDDKNSLQLQTWDKNESNAQQFKFEEKSTGWYVISPKCAPGRAIDNPSGSTASGQVAQTWEKNNNVAQNYRIERIGRDTFRLINQASLLALTDMSASGGKVEQKTISNDQNQLWKLVEVKEEVTTTKAPETTTEAPTEPPKPDSTYINVEGYQISTLNEGFRIVSSVEPTINNKTVSKWGVVYALSNLDGKDTGVTTAHMTVGSTNNYVTSFESTEIGRLHSQMGASSTAIYYAQTMEFGYKTKTALTAKYSVRPYVKYSNGTYAYGDTKSLTIYNIADVLYKNNGMGNETAHNYLYDNILKVVDENYGKVDFDWNNTIVKFYK